MISFRNVSKRYPGGQDALSALSFDVATGEMAFLTGRSGAGKSTLLRLAAALEHPSAGQVLIEGVNISRLRRRQLPALRQKMGVIFQSPRLLNERNVYDNVALPLIISGGLTTVEMGRRIRGALDRVGLLGKERSLPLALSGGEQQRVSIARAIVHRPSLLLADEPTGNLDAELATEIMLLFAQFNQVGVTVLIASHNLELVARIGKRVIALEQGRLLETS